MAEEYVLGAPKEKEEGDWVPIPDNSLLRARVLSVGKVKMPFTDRETGEEVWKVEWTFQITDPASNFTGRKVKGQTSTAFVNHESCRMYQWVKALLDSDLPEGFKFNTDDVVGNECFTQISAKTFPRKDGNGDFTENKVTDVRPAEKQPVAAAAYGDVSEEPF